MRFYSNEFIIACLLPFPPPLKFSCTLEMWCLTDNEIHSGQFKAWLRGCLFLDIWRLLLKSVGLCPTCLIIRSIQSERRIQNLAVCTNFWYWACTWKSMGNFFAGYLCWIKLLFLIYCIWTWLFLYIKFVWLLNSSK